jgi:hypothetical protein
MRRTRISSGLAHFSAFMRDSFKRKIFQAERRRYAAALREAEASPTDAKESTSTRPPRAKTPSTPSSNTGSFVGAPENIAVRSSNRANNRSSTPPRRGADPGASVDPNFVEEDWDDDNDAKSTRRAGRTKSSSGRDAPSASASSGPGVKADENWLDEDFDA